MKYLIETKVNRDRGERVVEVADERVRLGPAYMQDRQPCFEYRPEGVKRWSEGCEYLDDRHVWPSREAAEAELARRRRTVRDV
jgi:hypothetical protein